MNSIRHYMMIVEANWEYSYKFAYRSWYLPSEKRFVRVNAYGSHVAEVASKPEEFGLSREQVSEEKPKDRDPAIMDLMCSHGWVRIAGADRNNPQKYMIFEGADLQVLLAVMKMFYYDQKGELAAASIKVRNLDGTGGIEYAMHSPEQVKAAALHKQLPPGIVIDASDALAA